MNTRSIHKWNLRRKSRNRGALKTLSLVKNQSFRYAREAELKEKYRYSKDDLEHLFV
ncbi:hypothetical protein KFE98_05630 [bacterium SCSIO 12741]|nr:hypothetical protein KFE98_05630 [bacterium SCSIO 12741]